MSEGRGTGQNPESPDEIEREIERTREDMSRTLSALDQKLSTRELANEAIALIKERVFGQEGSRQMIETIRHNPVPSALVGIGIAWLLIGGRGGGHRAGRHQGKYQSSGEEVGSSRIGSMTRDARRQASRYTGRVGEFAHGNPLLVGAAGLLAGAALGTLLPASRMERRYLGPAAHDAWESVAGAGRELVDQAGDAARQAGEAALGAAREALDTLGQDADQNGAAGRPGRRGRNTPASRPGAARGGDEQPGTGNQRGSDQSGRMAGSEPPGQGGAVQGGANLGIGSGPGPGGANRPG